MVPRPRWAGGVVVVLLVTAVLAVPGLAAAGAVPAATAGEASTERAVTSRDVSSVSGCRSVSLATLETYDAGSEPSCERARVTAGRARAVEPVGRDVRVGRGWRADARARAQALAAASPLPGTGWATVVLVGAGAVAALALVWVLGDHQAWPGRARRRR